MKKHFAALALASAMSVSGLAVGGFMTPANAAEGDVQCGTPAVEEVTAVFTRWSLQGVEYRWTRDVVTDPGSPAWDEEVVVEPAWTETIEHPPVFETVHHEAVYGPTEYEFRHERTGEIRWNTDPNWNANGNPNSVAWEATGNTRAPVLEEAWDEEVMVEDAWTETIEHPALTETVHHPEVPPTVVAEYVWSVASPGDGWTQTGESQPGSTTQYEWAIEAPGPEWQSTGETEERVVTPGQEAGPPCPE